MWRTILVGTGILLGLPVTLVAQGGAVPVSVTVSVTTEDGRQVQPVRFVIVFIPERPVYYGDYFAAQTDAAGRAELTLRPGTYRVWSSAPLRLPAAEYNWDLSFTVEPSSGTELRLTESNAKIQPPMAPGLRIVETPIPSAAALRDTSQAEPQPALPEAPVRRAELQFGDPGYRDPGTARLIGVFIPGGGHFYSGEPFTGFGILVGEGALVGAGVSLLVNCDESVEDCNTRNAVAGASFVAALGVAVYSIVDAGRAARRANVRRARVRVALLGSPGSPGLRAGLVLRF